MQPEFRMESSDKNILDSLRNSIHKIRIIDASRSRLLYNWDGKQTRICFDKQAAFTGKLKLIDDSEESPSLGFIEVQLDFEASQRFEEFLDWFTPSTKEKRGCQVRL